MVGFERTMPTYQGLLYRYLSERIDDLFPVSAYIDHQEFNIHSGLKVQATKHVGRTI